LLNTTLEFCWHLKCQNLANNITAILARRILQAISVHIPADAASSLRTATPSVLPWFACVQPLFAFAVAALRRLMESSANALPVINSNSAKVVYHFEHSQLECLLPLSRRAIVEVVLAPPVLDTLYSVLLNAYAQVWRNIGAIREWCVRAWYSHRFVRLLVLCSILNEVNLPTVPALPTRQPPHQVYQKHQHYQVHSTAAWKRSLNPPQLISKNLRTWRLVC
jgi:hypothetical protein